MKQDEGSFDRYLAHCIETQEYTQTEHYKTPTSYCLSFPSEDTLEHKDPHPPWPPEGPH